jgi:dienelactone hydrolase
LEQSKIGRCALWISAWLIIWMGLAPPAWAQPAFPKAKRYKPTEAERALVSAKVEQLAESPRTVPVVGMHDDVFGDVAVFLKAGQRALRFDEFFDKKDVATTLAVLDRGLARVQQLRGDGAAPWTIARGSVGRGFHSRVDGSVQPYAVIVPEGLELSREKRARLDVVLHGRDQTISEARFLARFDGKPTPEEPEADARGKITLHVFGRGNNAYRWAGETDVFEAIEAVKRNYPIDGLRIVLRGFSMGGAGAWHLGLHHPSVWSSVEAGAGFTETRKYAKLDDVPTYIDKGLHIYDTVDYALNAFNVPIAGYGGEDDPQLQASTNIVEALRALGVPMKTEGLLTRNDRIDFLRVVGAKMGHKVDPASAKILRDFHDEHADKGDDLTPQRIRFVTYTLKYSKAAWLSIEVLGEHYRKAEVDAQIEGNGERVRVRKAENVTVLAIERHVAEKAMLGDQEFPLQRAVKGLLPNVYFRVDANAHWRQLDHDESRALEENAERGKRRGLQGPIDDVFTQPFLCVAATGTPWSSAAGRFTKARLEQFLADWAVWMRGDARVKKDTEVTPEDIENHNLILFGDPGSNLLIARILQELPITWGRDKLTVENEVFSPVDHVPTLVAPNPLNPHRYVVINSGHTFGAREFAGTNALLYPRLGDYAVFQTDGRNATLKTTGFFDERWSRRQN